MKKVISVLALFLSTQFCFAAGFEAYLDLRVGNQKFEKILRETLLKFPSRLKVEFSDENYERYGNNRTSDGFYNIEGDPDLFPQILYFMKTGKVKLKSKNEDERQEERLSLYDEADHYCLSDMLRILALDIFRATPQKDYENFPTEIWNNIPEFPLRYVKRSYRDDINQKTDILVCDDPNCARPTILGVGIGSDIASNQQHIVSRKKNIVVTWNGTLNLPTNIVTGSRIGEDPEKVNKIYDSFPLLQHIIRGRFLCSRLKDGKYGIYDAVTALRIKDYSHLNYIKLDDCIDDLYSYFGEIRPN